MALSGSFRIQSQAAAALAEWKALFAEQVGVHAKALAEGSDPAGLITIEHYRQAARIAAETVAARVNEEGSDSGRQEAA